MRLKEFKNGEQQQLSAPRLDPIEAKNISELPKTGREEIIQLNELINQAQNLLLKQSNNSCDCVKMRREVYCYTRILKE